MNHPSTLDFGASSGRAATRSHRPRVAAGRLWPWIPALLLGSLIGAQMTVLAFVLDDPTFATEEDYYRKAVDWDARMLRERQSRALGWTARLSVESTRQHPVSLQLRDARGQAVSNARVNGVAFHNARAGHPLVLALEEVSPGLYRVELGGVRPGLWELRVRANRGRDDFETTHRFEVPADGDAR
jgi:nitrogen fixation protein FixH